MKTTKKLLSLILALVLLLSVSVPAFAEKKPYTVSYFSDSMGIGYLLDGFINSGHGIGWRQTGALDSYPSRFTNEVLAPKYGDVKAYYLGATGMRPNEFCVLLDPGKYEQYQDVFTLDHVEAYRSAFNYDVASGNPALQAYYPAGQTEMTAAYQQAIKESDLIVYDLGVNNFGTYLINRIMYTLSGTSNFGDMDFSKDSLSLILRQCSPALGNTVDDLRAFNRQLLAPLGAEKVDYIVDALVYTYLSTLHYFDKSMDLIYKLNPGVDVIVVGMFNPIAGVKIDLGGLKLDIDELVQNTMSRINFYITGLSAHRFQYKYADISNGVSRFIDEIASGNLSAPILDLVINDFYSQCEGYTPNAGQIIAERADKLEQAEAALAAPVTISLEAAPVETVEEIEEVAETAEEIAEIPEEIAEVAEVTEEVAEVTEEVVEIPEEIAPVSIQPLEETVNSYEAFTPVTKDEVKASFLVGGNPFIRDAMLSIVENYSKACRNPVLHKESLEVFTGDDTSSLYGAIVDYDTAEVGGRDMLFINSAFNALDNAGVHPDKTGCAQKLTAVKSAFNSRVSAAGNIPEKLIEAPIKAAAEIVKSVLVPPTKLLTSVVKGVVNATKSLLVIRW